MSAQPAGHSTGAFAANMIERTVTATLKQYVQWFPVILVTGPRQAGKTTLVQMAFPGAPTANLEQPSTLAALAEDPQGFLAGLLAKGTPVLIDEAQRFPSLFSWLQVIADREGRNGLFVITGSQNFLLGQHVSQSLAGRLAILRLLPLALAERPGPTDDIDTMLHKGLYPRLFDRRRAPPPPPVLYDNYVATYLERDLRQISAVQDLTHFHRFLRLCAARTGQLLNKANLAVDTGISQPTAEHWISVLEASHILFRLQSFHANLGKRLVKAPKLYFCDTGLACHLAGIATPAMLETHPMRGALFENLVFLELLKRTLNAGQTPALSFFRDKTGNEVDFVVENGTHLTVFEAKCTQTFRPEHLDGIRAFRRLLPERKRLEAHLLYAGAESLSVDQVTVANAAEFFAVGPGK
jgi:predicted AAA+ superfamily ATPase